MSKKQLLFLSLVAAIPATGLLVLMLFSLRHLLSDQSSASAVLWVIYVVCLLGSAFFASLPLWLWLYYPAAGFGVAGVPIDGAQASGEQSRVSDDEGAAEEEFTDDQDDAEDDGEKLFDEDAMDDDFDEFDGGFDAEEK